VFDQLLARGAVKRPGPGRPRPDRICGDKAYTGRQRRQALRRRGIRYTLPRLSSEPRRGPFDRALYRRRNVIERLIGRCKQYRGIATRYEKLALHSRAAWLIVFTMLWISL
jgi:transposase